jgi:hypothetical protein
MVFLMDNFLVALRAVFPSIYFPEFWESSFAWLFYIKREHKPCRVNIEWNYLIYICLFHRRCFKMFLVLTASL